MELKLTNQLLAPIEEQRLVINDVLMVLGDKKMYVNEKKLYISAIDLLYKLDYYYSGAKQGEKTSLYRRFIQP